MPNPKIKLAKLRELHAHLTEILGDCDAQTASDDSDAGEAQEVVDTNKPDANTAAGHKPLEQKSVKVVTGGAADESISGYRANAALIPGYDRLNKR